MDQTSSIRQPETSQRTRRLRYTRHKEDATWLSNPPDGSDLAHDTFKAKQISTEVFKNCKTPPKHRFPELFKNEKCTDTDKIDKKLTKKGSILQKLRRSFKEELDAENDLSKFYRRQSKILIEVEKKWPKNINKASKEPVELSDSIASLPEWFRQLLRRNEDEIKLDRLISPPSEEVLTPNVKKICSSSLKLVIQRQNNEKGNLFTVFEKHANKDGKSWQTIAIFTKSYITSASNNRVCLAGNLGMESEITFDLMVVNMAKQDVRRKLRGVYVRQMKSYPDMLTWLVKAT